MSARRIQQHRRRTGQQGVTLRVFARRNPRRFMRTRWLPASCFGEGGLELGTGQTLLSFVYGTNGLLEQIYDPIDDNHTKISRTSTQVTIEGPFLQTTKITLDPTTHYATSIEDATHALTYVSHDGNGLLTSLTDRNNNLHSFAYDSMGRLKKDANPVGFQSLERSATANGFPVTGTVAANGYSVSDTSAAGAVRTFAVTVDANGLETRTVTMPDKSQNVSKRPVVGSTTTTFADRSVVTATSAIDPVSLKSYPNYTELTRPSQIKTTVRLDKSLVGDTVSINGSAPWSKAFDSNTKTYTVNTPAGRTSTITVDDHDRPIKVTAPGITPITYHYDHGRLDSASQGYRLTRFAYYAAGTSTPGYLQRIKVTDTTDSRIIGTLLEPDSAGRPLHSTTCKLDSSEAACVSAPVKTDLGLDSEGNLRSLTPPGRPTHYQTFTGTNLLQSYTPPVVPDVSDTTTSFTYNRDGALDFEQMPSGWRDYVVAPTTGQLVSNGDANFEYYSATETSAGSAPGRLSKANASAVSQKFAYDGPLLTSEQTTWLNVNASVSVAFDVTAKLQRQTEGISVTASGGTSTTKATYDYADADGLLTCASLSTCSPGAANKLDLTRDPTTGALTGTTFGAVSDTYAWNNFGELASYSAQIGTDPPVYKVTYDPAGYGRDGFGRVMREVDQSGIRDYLYDEQGRLIVVGNGSFWVRYYTYDSNGNRLSTNPLSQTLIATYDDQDRLTSYEGTTYQYWANGALRRKDTPSGAFAEYGYSSLGNLTSVTLPTGTINYSYDGFGRRVQRVLGTSTTRYVYRDGLHLAAVLDENGALISRFVYASHVNVPDMMVLANVTVFRIISDQLGSPRVLVNPSNPAQPIAMKLDYDEFGNQTVTVNTGTIPGRAFPFGFAGGLYDQDTGLVHFGAREYDPVVGRWISKDPIFFAGRQANLYVYVANDPLNRLDPSGLWDVFVWRAIGAPIAQAGPVVGEIEVVAMTGYDSAKGAYMSGVGALGAQVGAPNTHLGIFYGADTTVKFTPSGTAVSLGGIAMMEVVGKGGVLGMYRTSGGEWGAYAGYEFGFLGPHASGGVGAALPHSWQHWLESKWTAAKALCR